mgnify:CR=1 FL=1
METPLTASNKQGDKLRERLGIALEKSGVAKDQVQLALAHPGTGLEDEMVDTIIRFSKKASGIATPLRAVETGLIPSGWSVESDDLEGEVDLGKLDFSYAPCKSSESYINGGKMIERAKAQSVLGSLGLAKIRPAGGFFYIYSIAQSWQCPPFCSVILHPQRYEARC